jgi:hypothetical protein
VQQVQQQQQQQQEQANISMPDSSSRPGTRLQDHW